MDEKIFSLVQLAELIQYKINDTQDQDEKDALQRDLNIIMNEIGKIVFELPLNEPIFPKYHKAEEPSESHQTNSFSSIKEPTTKEQSFLNSSFYHQILANGLMLFLDPNQRMLSPKAQIHMHNPKIKQLISTLLHFIFHFFTMITY